MTGPRITEPTPEEQYSGGESLGYGGIEGATFKQGDELAGASYSAQSALGLNDEIAKPHLSTVDPRARNRLQKLLHAKQYGGYFGKGDPAALLEGGPTNYETGRDIAREINRESAAENPALHGTGEIFGTVATGMGTGAGIAKVAPRLGAGIGMAGSADVPFLESLASQGLVAGAEGAVYGQGASEADTVGGQLSDAAESGLYGMGGGALGHSVVKGTQRLLGSPKEIGSNVAKKFGVDADVVEGLLDKEMRPRINNPISYKKSAEHMAEANTNLSKAIDSEQAIANSHLNKNPTIDKKDLFKQIDGQLVADDVVVQKVVPKIKGRKNVKRKPQAGLELPWEPVGQRGTSPGTFRPGPDIKTTSHRTKNEVVLVPMPGDTQARASFRAALKAKTEIARSGVGSDKISEANLKKILTRVDRNVNWDNADMYTSNAQKKKLRFLLDDNLKNQNPAYREAMKPVADKTDLLTSVQDRFNLTKKEGKFQPGYQTSPRSKTMSTNETKWMDQELVDRVSQYSPGNAAARMNIRKDIAGKALADKAEKSTGLFRTPATWALRKGGGMIEGVDDFARQKNWGDYTRYYGREGGRLTGQNLYGAEADQDYFKQFE